MKTAAIASRGILLIGLCLAGDAAAQTPVSPLGSCADLGELRGFTIRQARLEDPFWMLRWRKPDQALLSAVAALQGQPYTFQTVNAVSTQIESRTWLPDNANALVAIDYSDIGIVDCRDRQLDVVFRIFSAAPSPTLSTVFEWGAADKTPDKAAGLARTNAAWQVAPAAGFDRGQGFFAGGQAQARWSNSRFPFGALVVNALASPESHIGSASLVGEYESVSSWFRRATWRVVFDDSSTPTADVHLDDRRIGAQFFAASRPAKGVVTRFGGILEGGRLHSGFAASQLPAQTVADSDFTASQLFAGITGRGRQQSFTASYALMLASTGSGFHGDWRRHIGDVAHEFWRPIGNHRLFELEQRLTFGRLQTPGVVPATERFFGGAGDDSLLLGDDWRLAINPRIRSIPTNRFSPGGAGGDRFIAYNSTTAFTVWGRPAVPPEMLAEPEFDRALRQALTGARSTLDAVYRSGDVNFQAIKSRLPDVATALQRVQAVEAAARSSGVLPDATFRPCADALQASRMAADHAVADRPAQAYGWVAEMIPDGENALSGVVSACGVDLVAALKGVGAAAGDLESASNNLKALSAAIEMLFAAIDNVKSSNRAKQDLAYAERALDVILKQMNVTSLSPVFVFDVAHIGSTGGVPDGEYRYAVGGGIRLTLASTVNLTMTYALNPRRTSGEGSGALVFSLTTRNLFD